MLESLEERTLMAFSALGYSQPDLTVSGFASPVASWGGPLTVTVNVANIGASTINEPLALAPGATGATDTGPTTVQVYATKSPHSLKGAVPLGFFAIPALSQNSSTQFSDTFTLPQQPAGLPGDGGKVFIVFQVNATNSVYERNFQNNTSKPVPLAIEAPLPELEAVGLDLPATMQPGDTVQPNIRITNIGAADTDLQGPVTVALVASTTRSVNSGSTIVALYTISNIPSASEVATQGTTLGDANLTPPLNVVTIAGPPVTLPVSPKTYFLGVVVDPFNQIVQLSDIAKHQKPVNKFVLVRKIGPSTSGLPPAGVLTNGGTSLVPVFPTGIGNSPIGGVAGGTFPIVTPPSPPAVVGGVAVQ